jgi:TrpR-related protein YerC/YecD
MEVFNVQIDKLRGKQVDQLFDAILSLKDREECYRFFDDIATMSEVHSLSQRLQVAKMLTQGYTYNEIEKETKASTATISRVRRCLNFGSDGYELVLNRILNKDQAEDEKQEE